MEESRKYYLYAGEIYAEPEPHEITTVLGSCVSVCLYDSILRIGGMNHYQLPLWNGDGLASPKYGNIAIRKLIEKVMSIGSQRMNLKAKVFGGASVLQTTSSGYNVGERNISIAMKALADENILVAASHLGGSKGRKLRFQTDTGLVLMKMVRSEMRMVK